MTQTREEARQRTVILKKLRDQHPETVERIQGLLKEQKAVRRQITQQLRNGPKIVPEIAEATGIPPHVVLWHITAMKKYGVIAEVGRCGEYYQYTMTKEIES